MFLVAALFSVGGLVEAWAPPAARPLRRVSVRSASPSETTPESFVSTTEDEEVVHEEETPPKVVERVRFAASEEWYTKALPFMERPALLDGSLAADGGFDPFGLANSKVTLYSYREAEIKHARLAMLCAAGWILGELWDTPVADFFNLPSVIEENGGRDPSILNGGLQLISPFYWLFVVALTGVIELRGETVKNAAKAADKTWMLSGSWTPGDLGFDPLGLYTTLGSAASPAEARRAKFLMETAELKNGRLAMIAVLVFVIEEFVSGKPVVELTPVFFTPFPQVVENIMFGAPPLYEQY